MSDADALARLAAAVPPKVREVCTTLAAAGHQAVIVGGCVRDVLMGRDPGDWDVASSADPQDVLKLFKRTVPQGLQHGTVKVLMGKGKENEVEVTAFRGEGAYSDARRPDSVTFGVPLVDDLARRDLVVNAIAYDIAANQIIDPFGGREDIAARRLRAVGSPVDRFTEDGLRVMRAVRFAAQLEFDLDADTEAGIPPALPSLSKVSRERVSDELRKLLKAREPSRGLRPALRSGILANILPEVAERIAAGGATSDLETWLAQIDRAERDVRLAALCLPLASAVANAVLKRLKFSNQEIELATQLLREADIRDIDGHTAPQLRQRMARIDKQKRGHLVSLWAAQGAGVERARKILDDNDPLGAGDLAISGKDLMSALQMRPGPAIGRILEQLVNFVIQDPARNTRAVLLERAQKLELEVGRDEPKLDDTD